MKDNTKTYLFRILPVAKPRMTRSDSWKKRPAVLRYYAYKDKLRELTKKQNFTPTDEGMNISFGLPTPRSWSAKKLEALRNTPHKQKPDIDNLLKAFFDALLEEDSTIWQLDGLSKYWSEEPFIEVRVRRPVWNTKSGI